jgi:hypothetical protein
LNFLSWRPLRRRSLTVAGRVVLVHFTYFGSRENFLEDGKSVLLIIPFLTSPPPADTIPLFICTLAISLP